MISPSTALRPRPLWTVRPEEGRQDRNRSRSEVRDHLRHLGCHRHRHLERLPIRTFSRRSAESLCCKRPRIAIIVAPRGCQEANGMMSLPPAIAIIEAAAVSRLANDGGTGASHPGYRRLSSRTARGARVIEAGRAGRRHVSGGADLGSLSRFSRGIRGGPAFGWTGWPAPE